MKQLIFGIIFSLFSILLAQDSTVFYTHWDRIVVGDILSADSIGGRAHSVVSFRNERPIRIQHYGEKGDLLAYQENQFDSLGNHLTRKDFYPNGELMEEWVFQNDLMDIHLFRRIYGDSFKPTNRNYTVQRTFNRQGRETGYYVRGVDGKDMCHQITEYNADNRKSRELLVDDLRGDTILERKYRYKGDRTILEEFDGRGKMIQRVVLFDDDVIPAQP